MINVFGAGTARQRRRLATSWCSSSPAAKPWLRGLWKGGALWIKRNSFPCFMCPTLGECAQKLCVGVHICPPLVVTSRSQPSATRSLTAHSLVTHSAGSLSEFSVLDLMEVHGSCGLSAGRDAVRQSRLLGSSAGAQRSPNIRSLVQLQTLVLLLQLM